jgi:hypothetical protein
MALWEDLFTGSPKGVDLGIPFKAYSDTAEALNKVRGQRIANALSQIKLNYAPQMAQQAADTGAADTSIEQNKAKYAPQMSQATLQGMNLENQGRAINNKYAPFLKQLDIQSKQINNAMDDQKFKDLPAQDQAALKLKQAQLDFIKEKIKVLPQQVSNQTNRTDWYRGAAYQFAKTLSQMPPSARALYISQHMDEYNKLLQDQQGAAMLSAIPVPGMQSNAAQQGAQTPQNPASSIGQPPMDASQGISSPQQQQDIQQLKDAAMTAASKDTVSPYMTKKLDNTIQVEKFAQSPAIQMLAESAKDYAGIQGKGKEFLDRWRGDNSTKFENNIQFKNSFTSDLVNLQRNLEQLSVQPSQREELIKNIRGSFDEWSSNPKRAIDQFNRAMAQLQDIAGSTSVAAQPFSPGVREKLAGLESPNTNHLSNYINSHPNASDSESMVDIISPDGRPAEVPAKNLEKALARGYRRA